ncbi:urokinase plasminogen activator surface receptor-like isoform X2 [Pimephales promelas]|uniref:urokinase plasminogen activator surface receptor-like isoform X2 n=1 Tax=Pimephales promelas TaxID=90988 RepID=UPI001955B009|nr:urokinase plasminogen activator surface receptor-like isoform X2 [Pimephales promelas]
MTLYITLGLIALSFSTVFALRCYQCQYKYNSSCKQNLTNCPLQCGSITVNNNGSTLDSSEKNCTDPALCVTDAIHLGQNQMTFNPQCCDTNLCNTEEAPALLRYNRLMCYTCDIFNKDCSNIVTCSGDQKKCFSTEVDIIGVNTKGCASDIICGNSLLNTLGSMSGTRMRCCEGILCNSGQGLKQRLFLFLPLVTLLSLLFL